MSIARGSIDQALLTWLLMLVCLLGGTWGYSSLGRLEDPAFTIKEAVVHTTYAGASAEAVAREVSEPLEAAIQKMGEVDAVRSTNRPGSSLISVEMKSTYGPDELPGIWTELRNRVADAARSLPDGVSTPLVNDSFGDVFGIFHAVTADGFDDAEVHDLSTFLRRELLAVEGVADVEVAGLPEEAIFVDVSMPLAVNQNVDPQVVAAAIGTADSVGDAGELLVDGTAIRRQHEIVEAATDDFIVNLATSVAIVIVVLALFMGWRAAAVVGATLLLTVVGTLLLMALFSIEMERISLGALIIAMGMLVDNAIVVAEGMQMAMRRGTSSRDAAEDVGAKTQFPLLGATVIGIMAFAGIGLSPDATGEFLFSLFAVIAISLMLSWLLALTATPLLGHYLFVRGEPGGADDSGYDGPIFRAYAATLRAALRLRWLVVAALVGITVLCYAGFANVPQQFFPPSNTPMFFVHYKLPQGADIGRTSEAMARVERWLGDRDDVVEYTTFVGQGATRFILTYSPEAADESYGHAIVRTVDRDVIPEVQAALEAWAAETMIEGDFRTERLVFGSGGGYPIEARFGGSDPVVLRHLAERALEVFRDYPELANLRTDWHQPEIVLSHDYAADRAQTVGVTREDIASLLAFATSGVRAGTLLEGERQIPIIARQ